jgi:hypothetical protein
MLISGLSGAFLGSVGTFVVLGRHPMDDVDRFYYGTWRAARKSKPQANRKPDKIFMNVSSGVEDMPPTYFVALYWMPEEEDDPRTFEGRFIPDQIEAHRLFIETGLRYGLSMQTNLHE